MALRKPPLYDAYAAEATFTEFGGWEMPVEFDSIRAEHTAVRESVGIFDVSHMGEIVVSGADATELMQRLASNDITRLSPGESQYSAITDESGIILDDTIVYRLPEGEEYLFVPNAGHDEEIHDRWVDYRDQWNLDATVENQTEAWAMVAVQGPDAAATVDRVTDVDVTSLSKGDVVTAEIDGVESLTARTGYTGEDGFEILCPTEEAPILWSAFEGDCTPCGLGSRDTLRTEMGYLLSGQDFDPDAEPRTPYEAGIGWTVALDTDFVGRDALAEIEAAGVEETFVGLVLRERGIARHGYDIAVDGDVVGHVTSGTMSPTLGEAIALGYVPSSLSTPGTEIAVVVRDQEKRAEIVSTPFIEDN
ncbi:glycine cleavage system aminomethyltransferase GcvT [Halobellus captivus]|uniref:glycine cleavage system aminomethyltransferase GcvT n=1 Tax=Halobellus captivus TaxID=2592614 RepID=UPI0011A9F36D|nr:glycine cleavage system aminomethyltransferase GcvT [Halobellus captivus]